MFRILPFLLLTLSLLMLSKIFNVFDFYFDKFHISESIAELNDKDVAKPTVAENENPKIDKNQVLDTLQMKSQVQLFSQLNKKKKDIELEKINSQIYFDSLNALQDSLNNKISQLNELQGKIKTLVNSAPNQDSGNKQERLIKVYESMKSKDAAKIFNNMQNNLLLDVTGKMKPAKLAAILADMDPEKAMELTALLAHNHDILKINNN